MPDWLDRAVLGALDAFYAALPRGPKPAGTCGARIISHRGERDNRRVLENTFAAFDALRGSGVWGIEFDVRWTRDRVPVVFHDADLRRLYGDRARLKDLSWRELAAHAPAIPDLPTFVRRYADEFHLMVEIKDEAYPDPEQQNRLLVDALAPAIARRSYHLLSLEPRVFAKLPAFPAAHTVAVARANVSTTGAEAQLAQRGGFCGHYALLSRAQIARHHAAGRSVGSGFSDSIQVLWRELERGVDWIFTNRALAMQRALDELRST